MRKSLAFQRRDIFFGTDRWVFQVAPMLFGSKADKIWGKIKLTRQEFIGVLRQNAIRREFFLGKVLQVERYHGSAPARMAAARTCLSFGSGRFRASIRGS